MSVSEVMREIERDLVFWDESGGGVTFSGGEPLAQPRFLHSLLDSCREKSIHTVVETCGMAKKDVLLELSEKVGLFLYDLKILDPVKHKKYTGVPNDFIVANLEALAQRNKPVVGNDHPNACRHEDGEDYPGRRYPCPTSAPGDLRRCLE